MAGTLEKMQAAGLEVDEPELTTPDELTEEPEFVLEDDEPAVVADELDESALVVQGDEQQRPGKKVEVPKQTLAELRRTRREAREQVAEKDQELQNLRQEMAELRRAVTPKPRYADFANDDDYEAALLKYHQSVGQQQSSAPKAEQRPNQPEQKPAAPDFTDAYNAHLDRVEKLGIPAQQYKRAEDAVKAVFGDGITDALIAAVGEGSEKAMLVLGTRPDQLLTVQRLLQDDPTGLKAVAHLGRLSAKVTLKSNKTISDAPRPTRSPTGGGHLSASAKAMQKKMDEAEKAGDVQAMVTLRRQQRAAERAAASK